MKDRYPKALQSLRNRGDYMLQSRTASDVGDKEPMTIEYDDKYQNRPNEPAPEEPEILANVEDYKEELMLIESGNFVLTAPSLAIQGIKSSTEQREDPPPDVGGIGRSRTESFEADFTGIEKTYTTFVNVAEDQIYPLELKFFLEAALEEGVESLPRKKNSKNTSSRRSMVTNHSKVTTKTSQIAVTKSTKSDKPSQSQNHTSKVEEKDSDSINSESKKFRLFPNFRDVATRRSRRIEAVRQRLLEGRKRDKKDKIDRTKEEKKEILSVPNAELSNTQPLPLQKQVKALSAAATPYQARDPTPSIIPPAIERPHATSPINAGETLQELAEKILGKEIPKSEVSVYDFTKSKRKKKKKKENTLNVSTSFPVLSSPDMSWDSPKAMRASQDDDIVKYEPNTGATKNDTSDTVTVARGVEAVYSGTDDDQGLYMTVEKDAPSDSQLLSTEKSILAETGFKLFADKSPNAFALSRSFDDVYHSSIVQSIRNEIVTTKTVEDHAPNDPLLAASADPAIQQDFKWFNFGWQQKQQPMSSNENFENTVQAQLDAAEERDDGPSVSGARLVLDAASPALNIEAENCKSVSNCEDKSCPLEVKDVIAENISTKTNSMDCKVDSSTSLKVKNVKMRHRKSLKQDVNDILDEYEGLHSVRLGKHEDDMSVITDRSEKVMSNFVTSFGKLLSLFGRKVNGVVTCAPMEVNGVSLIEDLTFMDDADENSAVVENEKERPPLENIQIKEALDEPLSPPKDVEETIEETIVEDIPPSKRVATMISFPSKNSSVSMASRMSSKTYDSEDSETVESDDDDENITRTSTGTSEWEEGAKVNWCSCTH